MNDQLAHALLYVSIGLGRAYANHTHLLSYKDLSNHVYDVARNDTNST